MYDAKVQHRRHMMVAETFKTNICKNDLYIVGNTETLPLYLMSKTKVLSLELAHILILILPTSSQENVRRFNEFILEHI